MQARGFLLALGLVSSFLLAVPTAQAASVGLLYLTPTSAPSTTGCLESAPAPDAAEARYVLAPTAPIEAGKGYLSLSSPATCVTYWDYVALAPFSVPGTLTVTLFFGCDSPTGAGGGEAPGVVSFSSTLITMRQNGDTIGNGGEAVRINEPLVCDPSALTELTYVVPDVGTDFEAGDVLTLAFQFFGPSGDTATQANAYIATGPGSLSVISGEGLPGVAAGVEALQLSSDNVSQGAPAGGDALYNLTITNIGPATEFTLSTQGLPDGYTVAFNPLTGTVAANTTAASVVRVTIPASATPGTKIPFTAMAVATGGGNSTLPLELNVLQPSLEPTSTTSDDGFTTSGTTAAAPGVELLANVLAIGLLVVALRRRVV